MDTPKQNTALSWTIKEAGTMYEMIFFFILSAGAAAALALAYLVFEILLFTIYKLDGGRLDIITYFKKM